MKKVIWKHELTNDGIFNILMPIGAEILALQTQDGKPCLWVLVEPEKEKEVRKFELVGTGHTINEPYYKKYIGTCQLQGGLLVLHLFERLF